MDKAMVPAMPERELSGLLYRVASKTAQLKIRAKAVLDDCETE
jgi:hypothetical protein